jgi:integrase
VVALLVAIVLNLPIYLRGNTYYLHTRIGQQQVKRSLYTGKQKLAIMRAINLLGLLMAKQPIDIFNLDFDNARTYKLDLPNGVMESSGGQDHKDMMEAMELYRSVMGLPSLYQRNIKPQSAPETEEGLTVLETMEKMFELQSNFKPATKLAYRTILTEFATVVRNPKISQVNTNLVRDYREWLAKPVVEGPNKRPANTARTSDNKMDVVRRLMNFAKGMGYTKQDNPASGYRLLSKKSKATSNRHIFERDELVKFFASELFQKQRQKDPSYYWLVLMGVHTGCRLSEIGSLHGHQFKTSQNGQPYFKVVDSKTEAGIREVPLYQGLLDFGLAEFIKDKDKIFKYTETEDKGAGSPGSKKFSRQLETLGIKRDKVSFHTLRKFANNLMKQNKVPYEVRCQIMGHEIEDVNNVTYSTNFNVDDLADMTRNEQELIAQVTGAKK